MTQHQKAAGAWRGLGFALGCVLTPTFLSVAMDFAIRPHAFLSYSWLNRVNYIGSTFVSAGYWGGSLWLLSRLFLFPSGRSRWIALFGLGIAFGVVIFPLTVFSFGGQALYHAVFRSYMARDTLRLGIRFQGTLFNWLKDWGGLHIFLELLLPGLALTTVFALLTRKAAPEFKRISYLWPATALGIVLTCFWTGFVESHGMQAAPPDTCFIHGAVDAARSIITGRAQIRRGITRRVPDPLPSLRMPSHRPNILLVVTESVRADALCSEPSPTCAAPFLDRVAPDRRGLGRLTTQAPVTFSACVMLWTGLAPTADFETMHRAPVLWELAKAVGYQTAYITSQNLRYDEFIAFTQRASIDRRVTADDLGAFDQMLGAKDELAAQELVRTVQSFDSRDPWFAVLHMSNTHLPYRVDPDLQPFSPASTDQFGDVASFKNRYLNSVRMQERTVAKTLRSLEALSTWSDTAVIFVSDHGEEFREHGGLSHSHSLFEEQIRVPGWLLAGTRAISPRQRRALRSWADRRTFSMDIHATVLDLLGIFDQRSSLPRASGMLGRSLLRPPSLAEPVVALSTASGVWEPVFMVYGAMQGDRLLYGIPDQPWNCYNVADDPRELNPQPAEVCGEDMTRQMKLWFSDDFGRKTGVTRSH